VAYEGANAQVSTFTDVVNTVLSKDETRVFVTSYGLDESTFGSTAEATVHGLFNSMIGQGWTLVAATGNNGAFENTQSSSPTVAYPASDPDVFAVGGTTLALNANGSFKSETAWSNGGGGCSSSWAAPTWVTTNSCSGRALAAPSGVERPLPWPGAVTLRGFGPSHITRRIVHSFYS